MRFAHDRLGNHLLAKLSAPAGKALQPLLEQVSLTRGAVLEEIHRPIGHVYFVREGIVSIVARRSGAREIEVALVGNEGMSGMALLHGATSPAYATYVQAPGAAWRIAASALRATLEQFADARMLLLRFAHAQLVQACETAVANADATLDQRLARWLLMAHDRLADDHITLTHEFLAAMLGTRRPGVSEAMRSLSERGLVEGGRGTICIRDRAGLEKFAGGYYGAAEREYDRLIDGRDF